MPELPEVETTRRGIEPYVTTSPITKVLVRCPKLRWPVPKGLNRLLKGQQFHSVTRRGKYLLLQCDAGILMLHLGMSGCLRIVDSNIKPEKHDHVDVLFENNKVLRFTDPRRFGSVHWLSQASHPLLDKLGPEPLSSAFNAEYLWEASRRRQVSVKQFIMNSAVVVGVGNIYACESLFMAHIHPEKIAKQLSRSQCELLVLAVKKVLKKAIKSGGTTLQDFRQSDGKPGYFKQRLLVYGRVGLACFTCKHPIRRTTQGQRSTFYCNHCQLKGKSRSVN